MPAKRQAVIEAEAFRTFHLSEAARLRSLTPNLTTAAAKSHVLEQAEAHMQLAARETAEADTERPSGITSRGPAPKSLTKTGTITYGFVRRS